MDWEANLAFVVLGGGVAAEVEARDGGRLALIPVEGGRWGPWSVLGFLQLRET